MKTFFTTLCIFALFPAISQVVVKSDTIDISGVNRGKAVTAQDINDAVLPAIGKTVKNFRKGDSLFRANGKDTSLVADLTGLRTDVSKVSGAATTQSVTVVSNAAATASSQAMAAQAGLLTKQDTGISYTKGQVDGLLFNKANAATVAGNTNSINNLQTGKLDISTAAVTYYPLTGNPSNFLISVPVAYETAATAASKYATQATVSANTSAIAANTTAISRDSLLFQQLLARFIADSIAKAASLAALNKVGKSIFELTQDIVVNGTNAITVSSDIQIFDTIKASAVSTTRFSASDLAKGKHYRLAFSGVYSTPGTATVATLIPLRLLITMGNAQSVLSATSLAIGATDKAIDFVVDMVIRTSGTSGTAMFTGNVSYETSTANSRLIPSLVSGSGLPINTTVGSTIGVAAYFDAPSLSLVNATGYSLTIKNATITPVN